MLSDILKTLYLGDDSDIYRLLNRSRYITDIEKNSDFLLLFNTGFRFVTHKGTYLELYFDLLNQEIIRTPKSPLQIKPPHLIGFIGTIVESQYLERVFDYFCVNIDTRFTTSPDQEDLLKGLGFVNYLNIDEVLNNGSFSSEIEILDGNGDKQSHSMFQIIDGDRCINLPLRRTFDHVVFYNGSLFSEYRRSDYSKISFNGNYEESLDNWSCDACGGDSNSGCLSTTGECYR